MFHVLGGTKVSEERRELVENVKVRLPEHALSPVSGMLKALEVNGATVWSSFIDRGRERSHVLGSRFHEIKDTLLLDICRKRKKQKATRQISPHTLAWRWKRGRANAALGKTAGIQAQEKQTFMFAG